MAAKKLTPSDFAYGVLLGEGAYGRVVHARRFYPPGRLGTTDYAIKIIEKRVVARERKVRVHCVCMMRVARCLRAPSSQQLAPPLRLTRPSPPPSALTASRTA